MLGNGVQHLLSIKKYFAKNAFNLDHLKNLNYVLEVIEEVLRIIAWVLVPLY